MSYSLQCQCLPTLLSVQIHNTHVVQTLSVQLNDFSLCQDCNSLCRWEGISNTSNKEKEIRVSAVAACTPGVGVNPIAYKSTMTLYGLHCVKGDKEGIKI